MKVDEKYIDAVCHLAKLTKMYYDGDMIFVKAYSKQAELYFEDLRHELKIRHDIDIEVP